MACRQSSVIATISSQVSEPPAAPINESLDRRAAFDPATLPAISVYLDTRLDAHGRAPDLIPDLQREFKVLAGTWLAGSPERLSFLEAADGVGAFLRWRS